MKLTLERGLPPNERNKIHEKLRFFRKNGSHYVKNRSLIEDSFFVKSSYTNLVQLADFTAWVIRRKYSGLNNPKVDILVDNLYKKISKKFHKSGGKILGFGLKIFPK